MLRINPVISPVQNVQTVNRQPNSVAFKGLPRDVLQISNLPKKSVLSGFLDKVSEFLGVKGKTITSDELKTFHSDFQTLFLREDISIEDTQNIIKRYKKIEQIRDKIEYAKAFYQETKRNFGFENIDLPLKFERGEKSKVGTTVGGSKKLMHEVVISPDVKGDKLRRTIFHELRHVKQNYYAASLDHYAYLNSIFDKLRGKLPEGATERDLQLAMYLSGGKMIKRWGKLTPDNIPQKDMEFAKKCLNSHKNYVNPHDNKQAYFENFLEQDAYSSEFKFEKLYNRIKSGKIDS